MKPETRQRVKAVMETWVKSRAPKLEGFDVNTIRQGYPFHQLIFSTDALMAARAERSIVTSMGAELYPRIAEALAQGRFQNVILEHTIEGQINEAAADMIERIITELREPITQRNASGRRVRRQNLRLPDQKAELDSILGLKEGQLVQRSVIADLYVGDFEGGPLFVELKTPLPNLDIAAESKKKMLYFLTLMDRQEVTGAKAFLGLTYNPFVTRESYSHSFTKRIMDMDNEVLIGSELWDYLGGPGAYDELLELVAEINPPSVE